MALPDHDSTKHHIGLGPTGALKGFIIDGGYQRNAQRFGAPAEFGGERDLLEPSILSRWTQDNFSGGGGQELWGDDDAMFARSKNLLPPHVERSARSVPPLVKFVAAGAIDAANSLGVFATGGKQVAVVDSDRVRFYNAETGALISQIDAAVTFQAATHDPSDNKVYAVIKTNAGNGKRLRRVGSASGFETVVAFSADFNDKTAKGIECTSGRDVVVSFEGPAGGQSLWLADINDARNDATITRVGRLPGSWTDSATYNGMTYILLTDSEQITQVVVWDGTSILPVHVFPYNFLGKAITEYGGRLYVCGSVADITGLDRYAALYELTGSSERLVKSFADEAFAGLSVPSVFKEMVVHDGLLFAGSDKGYLMAYDLTRDGLWSEIQVASSATPLPVQVRRLLSTREKLFAWCFDPNGGAPQSGFYRMATITADLNSTTYECELETSDFAPDPSRSKRLSEVFMLTRAAAGVPKVPVLKYSVNGGDTWTTVANDGTAVNGRFRETTYDLSDIPTTKVVRLRFSITKDTVGYEEFVAFTTSFLFLDTDKRVWRFTVNASDLVELLDGHTLDQDVGLIDSQLWTWKGQATLLDFKDINGETRKVQVTDLATSAPIVGELLPDGSREAFYSLALTEV